MGDVEVIDLGKLAFETLLPMVEARSRLTREEIAAGMREHPSVVARSFDPASDYFFRVHRIPYLCHLLGNDLLVRWMAAKLAYLNSHAGTEPPTAPALTPEAGLLHLVQLMREVGEAAEAIEETSKKGIIMRLEAKQIRREVGDVVAKCFEILASLESNLRVPGV